MTLIKMTRGTYGLYENNTVIPKTPKDKPFEVSDKEAERLVKLEVAKIISYSSTSSTENTTENSDEELTYNKKMNMAALSNIALKYGVDEAALNECKTKQQIIDLIDAKKAADEEETVEDEEDEEDDEDDEDDEPNLNDDDGVVG